MASISVAIAADLSDLRSKLAQTEPLFNGLKRNATQVQSELNRLGRAYDGSKIIREAEATAKTITAMGGAGKLTATEIKRASGVFDEYAAKAKAMGVSVSADVAKVRSELDKLNSGGGIGGALKGALSSGAVAGGVAGVVGGFAASAVQSVIDGIKASIREVVADARDLAQITVPFERLSGGASGAADKLSALRTSTQGLVRDAQLMEVANQASVLGLDRMGLKIDEVAGIATKLGRAVGQDATQATSDFVNGLTKGSAELLNNLGVIVRAEDAYKAYGARIGKNVDQLTDLERQQAIATIGMEKAKEAADRLGKVDLTAWDQLDVITNRLADLAAGMAAMLLNSPAILTFLKNVGAGVETIARWAGLTPTQKPAGVAGLGSVTGSGSRQVSQGYTTGYSTPSQAAFGDASVSAAIRDAEARIAAGRQGAIAAGQSLRLQDAADKARKDAAAASLKAAEQAKKDAAAGKQAAAEAAKAQRDADAARKKFIEDTTRHMNQLFGTTDSYRPRISFASGVGGANVSMLGGATGERPWFTAPTMGLGGATASMFGGAISGTGILRDSSSFLADSAANKTISNIQRISTGMSTLSGALSQLAQITGGLGPVSQALGSMTAAFGAGSSLGGLLAGGQRAGESATQFAARQSLMGGRAGAVFSGLSLGQSIGNTVGNPFLAGGVGAGMGALGGASMAGTLGMSAGAASGIGAVVVGGYAMWQAYRNRKAQREALERNRRDMVAEMGGDASFRGEVERVGYDYEYFSRQFNSKDKSVVEQVTRDLRVAMAERDKQSKAMAEGLLSTARMGSVLSPQQIAQIRSIKPGDSANEDVVEFLEQQQAQLEQGALQAAAVLQEIIDRAIEQRTRAGMSVDEAMKSGAKQTMEDFGAAARGTAAALYVAFASAIEQGEDALAILQRLGPGIQTIRELYEQSGQTAPNAFGQIESYNRILSGPAGDSARLAQGLGQALAAAFNTGMLSPELFQDIANAIGASYRNMELLGQGGADAARLMQPALQTLWQMIQDNPALKEQLDEQTRSLLEFAENSGIIGEKFRPAMDRVVDGINKLIDRFDVFIDKLQTALGLQTQLADPPGGTPAPGGTAGGNPGGPNGGDYPGFSGGTGGRLVDFGASTAAFLHGKEAVLTERDVHNINRRLVAASRPVTMGGGYGSQQIVMMLDGREIGRSTLKGMPQQAAVYAGAF